VFGIGFWELAIIAVVALLVAGPQRLPEIARETGRVIAGLRRLLAEARRDLQRELHLEEDRELAHKIAELERLMQNAPDRSAPAISDQDNSLPRRQD
jgi:sec-independent protein translocase protein TatB